MGRENPLTIHEIYAALTPRDFRSDWASESAAAKQAENYNVKSVFPFIQCQCFDKRRGVFYWKKSAFLKNKGAFLA